MARGGIRGSVGPDQADETALHLAATVHYGDVVAAALMKHVGGAAAVKFANMHDSEGRTALMCATAVGAQDFAEALLEFDDVDPEMAVRSTAATIRRCCEEHPELASERARKREQASRESVRG